MSDVLFTFGDLALPSRIVMAPMTRSRCTQPGDVPNAMNARHTDLPRRLADDLPLAAFDADTLFGGGDRGCVDYPAWPGEP